MKIKSFGADTHGGLTIETVDFQSPTLLVGLSGAGKSQLMGCLYETYQLLCGEPFSLPDGSYHLRFEHDETSYEFHANVKAGTAVNKRLVAASGQLPLQTLKIKDWVGYIHTAKIRQEPLPPAIEPDQIAEIKHLYQFIFQNIDDVQVEHMRFKEMGMDWIEADCLSDGMLKTFCYLTDLVTAPSGSVILIDEFENGLGPNCLGILLDEMLARSDVQLILSSHHPYVINNVPSQNWLVISRHQSTITSRSAAELGVGQTRYDAFFELMNSLSREDF